MKSPDEVIKRWLHPAVFAIWTGFLIYLLASQSYVAFLRPEFGVLLALAHFIAMGFMIAAMIRPKAPKLMHAILRAGATGSGFIFYGHAGPCSAIKRLRRDSLEPITAPSVDKRHPYLPLRDLKLILTLRHQPEELEGTREETPQERTILEIF
jgi:hypothetical protein